ncbi:hypothetical protein ACLQ2N_02485 [Streptomyces sp. DT224]|uniref:hypothetical protein n=1 Tax=unclassified Streptomyces TaxID=2593676 RepID=UPI001651766C|nr:MULTISPECIES: hypothetical protein [unclassified Streptomyces]WRZ03579.1 hypothetical protein OG959_09590 [Streptomyces sp. NBC_00385]
MPSDAYAVIAALVRATALRTDYDAREYRPTEEPVTSAHEQQAAREETRCERCAPRA